MRDYQDISSSINLEILATTRKLESLGIQEDELREELELTVQSLDAGEKYKSQDIVEKVELRELRKEIQQLERIRESLFRIKKVCERGSIRLDLSNLELQALPNDVWDLHNLQHLDLSGNALTSLPIEVNQLKNLIELNLTDNKFTLFPIEITELTNLEILELEGNGLVSIHPLIARI